MPDPIRKRGALQPDHKASAGVFGVCAVLLACSGGTSNAAAKDTGGTPAGGANGESGATVEAGGTSPGGGGRNGAGTTGAGATTSGGATTSTGATTSGGAGSSQTSGGTTGTGGGTSVGAGGTSGGATGNAGTVSTGGATGAGGTIGAGGAIGASGASGASTGGAGGAVTGGRNFLMGMFSSGSTIANYGTYLGYHPEVTYNSSYQDDHHKKCGQPISGLNDIKNYPVIISVFTYNADYVGTAQGKYDNCYEDLFTGLESKVNTIYGVRIDVEFYPQPPAADFKGSFNHIVAIAKKHFPARIKYIFNPNWDAGLGGAGYVPESADVVGPDAYNNPTWCQNKSSAQCAGDKFDPNHPGSIAYWTKIAQQLGKTMALPEWGDDYGDGVYIKAVADWAFDKVLVTPGKSNAVVYLGYWDSNLNEDGHLRGTAMTVFQQRFGNIPYTGTYWGPLIPTTTFSNF